MTDDELLTAFTRRTLDPVTFRHRDHLRVAWLLLERHHRPEAERQLLEGLRTVAEQAGRAERFDRDLSLRWIERIAAARHLHPRAASVDDLARLEPALLDPLGVRVER